MLLHDIHHRLRLHMIGISSLVSVEIDDLSLVVNLYLICSNRVSKKCSISCSFSSSWRLWWTTSFEIIDNRLRHICNNLRTVVLSIFSVNVMNPIQARKELSLAIFLSNIFEIALHHLHLQLLLFFV